MFFRALSPMSGSGRKVQWGGVTLALAALVAMPVGPVAAQGGAFELELNTAVDVDDNCRLTYVATNSTGIALTSASFEVAVFDGDGGVSSIVVFDFGAMPLNRTRVIQFDLSGQSCDNLSRIVVNNQVSCASSAGEHDVCDTALIASSRVATIQFRL